MTIPGKYENGVFKPLASVRLDEGTRVEVHVPEASDSTVKARSVRELPIFGMWADREDIKDGVEYEDRMRRPRF